MHYVSNPDTIHYTLTYGRLPTKRQFMSAYRREMGDLDADYRMFLRGADAEGAEDTVLSDAAGGETAFDADDLWDGLKQLRAKFEAGDDDAGDLASAILFTLGIEWV